MFGKLPNLKGLISLFATNMAALERISKESRNSEITSVLPRRMFTKFIFGKIQSRLRLKQDNFALKYKVGQAFA